MPRPVKSYVGQKFNSLTVIKELGGRKVLCRCDCGNVKVFAKSNVINGTTKTCGCKIGATGKKAYGKDLLVGKQFGRLTVVYQDGSKSLCYCRCGKFIMYWSRDIAGGQKKSCGCGKLIDRGADKAMPLDLFVDGKYIGAKCGDWTIIRQLNEQTLFAAKQCGYKLHYKIIPRGEISVQEAAEKPLGDMKCTGKWITVAPDLSGYDGFVQGKARTKKLSRATMRKCEMCGKEFIGDIKAQYCDECWLKRRRERTMNAYYNQKRKIGDIDHCVVCGKEYIVRGGTQKMCSDCAEQTKKYKAALRQWKRGLRKNEPVYPLPGRIVTKGKVMGGKRICIDCGKEFIGTWQSKLCPECRAKRQEDAEKFIPEPKSKNETKPRKITTIAPRKCVVCGAEFLGGPSAKYCPNCRVKKEKERAARYRKNGASRKLGSIDYCQACGKEYIVASGLQKYCPDCAAEQIKMRDRERGKEYMAEQRKLNPDRVKEWKRAKYKEATCPVCGKTFTPIDGREKTCSDDCRIIWTKFNQRLGTWRYRAKQGYIYKEPTLESVIEEYYSSKK